jgi:3-hydroxybutyrate dehydrogenase
MLKNKAALITGSTSGIGLGIAWALAREGVHVTLNGFGDLTVIEELRRAIATETGVSVRYIATDMGQPAAVTEMIAAAESATGGIDILVNNAGVQFVAAVDAFPPDRWKAIHDIMVTGAFHAIRAALPGMKRRNWGRIINIASAHGLVASPFKSAYVAAKHAQVGLTKSVALEVATHNITCNAICPGYVRTPLVESQIDEQARAHGMTRDNVVRDVILAAQPTGRFVEVDEVAQLAVYLCRDDARSITGAAIPIDGGWTAR